MADMLSLILLYNSALTGEQGPALGCKDDVDGFVGVYPLEWLGWMRFNPDPELKSAVIDQAPMVKGTILEKINSYIGSLVAEIFSGSDLTACFREDEADLLRADSFKLRFDFQ